MAGGGEEGRQPCWDAESVGWCRARLGQVKGGQQRDGEAEGAICPRSPPRHGVSRLGDVTSGGAERVATSWRGYTSFSLLPWSAGWGSCPPQPRCVPAGRMRSREAGCHGTNWRSPVVPGLRAPSRDESKADSPAGPDRQPCGSRQTDRQTAPPGPGGGTAGLGWGWGRLPPAGLGVRAGGSAWKPLDSEARQALRGPAPIPSAASITCNKGQVARAFTERALALEAVQISATTLISSWGEARKAAPALGG